jgi:hypothetical protein
MYLEDIKTREDAIAYVRERDHHGYLTEYESPEELFAFYIANYEFRERMTTAGDIRAYIDVINRVFNNQVQVREGFGGLICDNATSLFFEIMRFNCQENLLNDEMLENANKVMREVFSSFKPYEQ